MNSKEIHDLQVRRDDSHRYWIDDGHVEREAVGVTRTLVENNLVDDEYFTDLGRGRGKLVHFFAEHIALGTLGNIAIPVPQHITGYIVGLRKALDKHGPAVKGAEIIAANLPRLFAGGIDLDLHVFGGPAIWEIKTSQPTPWHGLQLAPYSYLRYGKDWLSVGRFGLYLNERGGFRLKEYDAYDDLERFFGALDTLHWRIRHGSYERPYGRRISTGYGEPDSGSDSASDVDGGWSDRVDGDPFS